MKTLKPLKPYMLRRWKTVKPRDQHYFFTCARPGRTGNSATKDAQVPDHLVHRWVLGLPGPYTAIVSLLGCKPDGLSEFSFYSFYGGFDRPSDYPGGLSFQQWLDYWHSDKSLVVREQPTCDLKALSLDTLHAVERDIYELASAGHVVVLIDSGGQTRTGQVCRHMGAVEDSSAAP